MNGNGIWRGWAQGSALGDPLAGLPEPTFAPGPLRQVAAAQTAAAGHLRALAARLRAAVGGQVGAAWVGPAAASASASAQQLAATHDGAAVLAEQTSAALSTCAVRWEQAHATYAHARRLADEALAQEAAHRAAGAQAVQPHAAAGDLTGAARAQAAADGSDGYTSPYRAQARAQADDAVQTYTQAAQALAHALAGQADVLTPPAPAPAAPAAPSGSDQPWWKDAAGWLGDRAADTWHGAEALAHFGGYAVSNPAQSLQVGADLGLSALGVLGMVAGAGGEVGGVALDATGVGAVAGVPAAVASAGLITAGIGTTAAGALKAGQDLSDMWTQAQADTSQGSSSGAGTSSRLPTRGSSDGGNGQWVGVKRGGGSSRSWKYQQKISGHGRYSDGTVPEYKVNGVTFDGFDGSVLQEAKGPGYAKLLSHRKIGPLVENMLVKQAQRQSAAAGGTPITWHFAEKDAAEAMQAIIRRRRLGSAVTVVWTP